MKSFETWRAVLIEVKAIQWDGFGDTYESIKKAVQCECFVVPEEEILVLTQTDTHPEQILRVSDWLVIQGESYRRWEKTRFETDFESLENLNPAQKLWGELNTNGRLKYAADMKVNLTTDSGARYIITTPDTPDSHDYMAVKPIKKFQSDNVFHKSGTGMIAVVHIPNPKRSMTPEGLPKIGEKVMINGQEKIITSLEAATNLTSPPHLDRHIGLVFKDLDSPDDS